VTIAAGNNISTLCDLIGYCRWIRIVADGITGAHAYYPTVSLNGTTNFWDVYINSTHQQGPASSLYVIFEIGYARYVKIISTGVEGSIRTINIRGYSL